MWCRGFVVLCGWVAGFSAAALHDDEGGGQGGQGLDLVVQERSAVTMQVRIECACGVQHNVMVALPQARKGWGLSCCRLCAWALTITSILYLHASFFYLCCDICRTPDCCCCRAAAAFWLVVCSQGPWPPH
jgi:hypothetical protein